MHPPGQQLLVVDHDPVRRREIERLLIEEGFAVTAAGEGLAAIRAAGQRCFALAVTALGLPGWLDGPTTAQQLRARQPWLKALYTADPAERRHGPVRDRDVVPWPCRHGEFLGCVFEMLQRDRFSGAAAPGPGRAVFRRR